MYLVSEFKPTPTSRKFDKIKPDCKLSRECLVFHSNILIIFKIAEFRTPTPQDIQKKDSEILKLLPVRNCVTLTMTNKLIVITNNLKYLKLRKFYYMKWNFLYQITTASRTPDYGATTPRSPFSLSSVLNWICWNAPPPKKNPGYATGIGRGFGGAVWSILIIYWQVIDSNFDFHKKIHFFNK